jgi:hypothetical protein
VESLPGSLAGFPFKIIAMTEEDYVIKFMSTFGD